MFVVLAPRICRKTREILQATTYVPDWCVACAYFTFYLYETLNKIPLFGATVILGGPGIHSRIDFVGFLTTWEPQQNGDAQNGRQ